MKVFNLFLVVLVLGALGITSFSCAAKPSSAPENLATVQRGNLTIDITASGNLALSHKEDLAFEMAGIVEDVLVKAGDSVKEGQVLAKLDTKAWEDQITTLESQLIAAKRKVTTAGRNVTAAERQLTAAEKQATAQVKAKEQACQQAGISLKNAETALAKAQNTYEGPKIEMAQADVDKAKAYLEYALQRRAESPSTTWDAVVSRATADLDAAQKTLNVLLIGGDLDDIALKKTQLEIAQANLKDAQEAIPEAVEAGKIAVENARIAVDDAGIAVGDAQQGVADAQEALDEAKALSPEVKAPFAGLVTMVNVSGGGEVKKGTVALQIADPTKFETEVLVSEMDLFNMKVGENATVQVNAMPTINLSANVTRISPTATIQSGVVNYKVKVEIKSPEAVMQERQAARQAAGTQAPTTQGQRPSSVSGNQAPTTQFQGPSSTSGNQTPTTLTSQIAQLKEGLTVTVSIVVDSRSNVLLVPNRAITRSGRETNVQVLKDGVAESRSIKTGLNDGLYTEVTEGLSEGEQVVITKTTTTTTTTSTQRQQSPGGFMIPGLGR